MVTTQVPPRNHTQDQTAHAAPLQEIRIGGNSATGGQWQGLLDTGKSLLRHRAPMLWTAAFGALAALIASAIQPSVYQSRATIQIQGLNENFLNLRDIYPTAAPGADNVVYVQTQAEMLRQDALIEQVVRQLHLGSRPEFQPTSAAAPNAASDIRAMVEQVKKNLQIVPSRGSSIIQIVCDARDPQLAADIANGLGQAFIEQSIEARQHAAKETEAALSAERDEIRKKLPRAEAGPFGGIGRHSATGFGVSEALRREEDANRQLYEALSRRIDEARLASTLNEAGIRLVGPAQPAVHPYKPNLLLNLVVGIFAGLGLGLGFVMLRDQTDTVVRAPGDASACLGIPELGVIPKAEAPGLAALAMGTTPPAGARVERASFEQPSSELSESFRAIVASILAAGHNGDHPRVLLVTSSRPLEGKTTVVSNLGIALTELGRRVLLIDGDLRHPRLHKIFDQANSWGLSDLLREKNAIEDLPLESLVKKTAVPHLYLLPGGTSADHIFGLLWSGRLARLLPRFREEFDYVLVDAPPCLPFADARIMGRQVEKLLLVVRADSTDKRVAQAALERLSQDGIPTMGAILNCCDRANRGPYGYENGNGRKDLA